MKKSRNVLNVDVCLVFAVHKMSEEEEINAATNENLEKMWDDYLAWCRDQENGTHE